VTDLVIGIDIGTSGARGVAMAPDTTVVADHASRMADHGDDGGDPAIWTAAVEAALAGVLGSVDARRVRAIAVDGTSGTVLAVDDAGRPLARPLMYNDPVEDKAILDRITALAPPTSAAHGPTSGLAKAIVLARLDGVRRVLHQADWIAGRFSGRFDVSDDNNALKTGWDPVARRWPDWIAGTGLDVHLLPDVVEPGTPVGTVTADAARAFGFDPSTLVVAGTTDGCASFIATGADEPGAGVTALGTTMTIKLLSDAPIFAPEYGIYSHRVAGRWLAGGASNTGGKALLAHFEADRLATLSGRIDPETDSGLDYYPLPARGERFPIADPDLAPRVEPRPSDDAAFLKGLLEGIAVVETLAYRRLAELGGPPLSSVRTVGGGAANAAWTRIRERRLGVPMRPVASGEAAAGAARLALSGARSAGVLDNARSAGVTR
jgi:sugar (pentulose or hexulose) kinase